jgi:hypothetical protein
LLSPIEMGCHVAINQWRIDNGLPGWYSDDLGMSFLWDGWDFADELNLLECMY